MTFIQNLFTSRDNNANSATYVGQQDRIWWDPVTNSFYYSDGNTVGGIAIGGGGTGSPGAPNASVQFNQNGNFGGSSNLTFDGSNLTIGGSLLPAANNTFNLGSPTQQWASVYLSANTLYFNSIPLSAANANALLYNSLPIVSQTANGNINVPGTVNAANVSATGNIVAAGFQLPNGDPVVATQAFVTSNIANLQAGLALNVAAVYGNAQYPAGVFTLYQSANLTPTITVSDVWSSSGTANKDQYLDFANGVVATSNVSITLGLSSSTFNVQSTDHILIGTANITGANLTGLGISGTGGTYTIPAAMVGNTVAVAATSAVSVSLSTVAANSVGAAGTTLTTTAPVPFALGTISPTWTYPNIVGNVGNSQPINWTYSVTTGTVLSGNIIVTGSASLTQTSNTATSGVTSNVISTAGSFTVKASIQGNGTHGAGTSTSNVQSTLAAANVVAGTLTITDIWSSSGTANKDQYLDFANGVVNTSNVTMNISLSSGTFSVQSSDVINIGNATITGANLTGIGITGTGGVYTIPAAMIAGPQTQTSAAVTANLTTTGGALTGTGTTLTTTAPVAFALANVVGSWTYPNVTGNVGNSQPINWTVAVTTGTVLSGNIIVTGNANITQSANTTLSGSTANVISTAGNFNIQASYQGNGTHGAGTTTSNVSVVLPAANVANVVLVGYRQVTTNGNSSLPPANAWVDCTGGRPWAPATPANLTPANTWGFTTNYNNPTNNTYYWLAVPDSLYWSYGPITPGNPPDGLFYNYYISLGIVNDFPTQAYGNGTDTFGGSGGNVSIGGQPYVVLGFTGYSNIQSPSNPPNLTLYFSTSATS